MDTPDRIRRAIRQLAESARINGLADDLVIDYCLNYLAGNVDDIAEVMDTDGHDEPASGKG